MYMMLSNNTPPYKTERVECRKIPWYKIWEFVKMEKLSLQFKVMINQLNTKYIQQLQIYSNNCHKI